MSVGVAFPSPYTLSRFISQVHLQETLTILQHSTGITYNSAFRDAVIHKKVLSSVETIRLVPD